MSNLVDKLAKGMTVVGAGFGIGTIAAKSCFFVVNPGERAVLFSQVVGVKDQPYNEGIHFKQPMIERPVKYDIRCKPREIGTQSGTKDQQTVEIRLRVLTRPIASKLPWLYDNYGVDYDERILPGIGNEVLKSVVAQYNAEELITKRNEVSERITSTLKKKVGDMGVEVDDVSLIDLQFSAEFMQAVEMKQIAQQEAERREHVVAKNEFEKQAAITRAEGEAQAASLIERSIRRAGNGFLILKALETQREIIRQMAEGGNISYVPGGVSMLLPQPNPIRAAVDKNQTTQAFNQAQMQKYIQEANANKQQQQQQQQGQRRR